MEATSGSVESSLFKSWSLEGRVGSQSRMSNLYIRRYREKPFLKVWKHKLCRLKFDQTMICWKNMMPQRGIFFKIGVEEIVLTNLKHQKNIDIYHKYMLIIISRFFQVVLQSPLYLFDNIFQIWYCNVDLISFCYSDERCSPCAPYWHYYQYFPIF